MTAGQDAIWAVLADGYTYAGWVVGTVKIRAVDAGWPAVGSKLHHAFGAWPLMLKDDTEVLECEPGRRLVLQARGWPAGEATIELVLRPHSGRTDVEMTDVEMSEQPTAGPGAWVHNKAIDAIGARRLAETLERLGAMATRHS